MQTMRIPCKQKDATGCTIGNKEFRVHHVGNLTVMEWGDRNRTAFNKHDIASIVDEWWRLGVESGKDNKNSSTGLLGGKND